MAAPRSTDTPETTQSASALGDPSGAAARGIAVIGQADARANEHLIVKHSTVVQEGIVLYLATTANLHIEIDQHVFPDDAIVADGGAAAEV
jgi:hypothetical protein